MNGMLSFSVLCCALLFVLAVGRVRAFQKCYTRKLTTCVTNRERNATALYRMRAKEDTFVDLRLGPATAKYGHAWMLTLAKDRMLRCMPSLHYPTTQNTPCASYVPSV